MIYSIEFYNFIPYYLHEQNYNDSLVQNIYADDTEVNLNACSVYQYVTSDKHFTSIHFLEDFDYLVFRMNESFPFFGVAMRRLGVDLGELLAYTRTRVADIEDEYYFLLYYWNLLKV